MSAKLLRSKQLQNQLAEAQAQINELTNENRMLKSLYKRQDIALKKYEGSQEQLPQLIKSHSEEMRILSSKYKQLRANHRDLENKLKQRDSEILNLKEQNLHLIKLCKDKNLVEREKLTKKVELMEHTIKEQHQKIQMLNRKLELESKNYRYNLNLEINKHKETHNELKTALATIETLKRSSEGKNKYIILPHKLKRSTQNSQLSLPGATRISLRKNDQRLVQSENAIQDGTEMGTVSSALFNQSQQESNLHERGKGFSDPRVESQSTKKEGITTGSVPVQKDPKENSFLSLKSMRPKGSGGSNEGNVLSSGKSEVLKDIKGVVSMNKTTRREASNYSWSQDQQIVSKPANVSFYDVNAMLNWRENPECESNLLSSDETDEDIREELSNLGGGDGNESSEEGNHLGSPIEKNVPGSMEESSLLRRLSDVPMEGKGRADEEEIDRLVEEACKGMDLVDGGGDRNSSDEELKEFERFEAMTWDEFKREAEGTQLAETRKADLLRALDEIDREAERGQSTPPSIKEGKLVTDGIKTSILEKINKDNQYDNFLLGKTKKKSDVIKELFGNSTGLIGTE